MMKFFTVFLLFLFSLKISAQIPNFSCNDFKLDITSNVRNSIDFLSEENYVRIIKDSVTKKRRPAIKENKDLYEEFQKKYPKKITTHCINSKYYEDDTLRYASFCDSATTVKLITKEYNFYIFHVSSFEIDNYLLFKTDNQTIYSTSNYPIILDEGKTVFDVGYFFGGFRIARYYKFNSKKVEYLQSLFPAFYSIKNFKIINKNNTKKIVLELIRYNLKEVSPNRSEYDENDFCRKFLMIN